jgi:hypothetical protein
MVDKTTSMIWHFDVQADFQSHKFAPRALDKVSAGDADNLTTSKSRLIGAAIQFIHPTGYIARREREIEEKLQEKGVDIHSSNMHTITDDGLFDAYPYADLVTKSEYDDTEFGTTYSVSITQAIADSIDAACDESEEYNLKQKGRFVSNCIIAFDRSVFTDLLERVETKEQLLKAVRGETVEEPTRAFENIRDAVWFEDLHEQVFGDGSDLAAIEPTDDVVLPEDHPVVRGDETFKSLGVAKSDGRAGAFMAYLRAKMPEMQCPQKVIEAHYELVNPDYTDTKYAVETHILNHLHEGPNEQYYLDESDVPKAVEADVDVDEFATVIVEMEGEGPSGRGIEAAVRDICDEEMVDRVSGGRGTVGMQAPLMAEYMSLEELQKVLNYLTETVSQSNEEQFCRNILVDWEDYIYYKNGDF